MYSFIYFYSFIYLSLIEAKQIQKNQPFVDGIYNQSTASIYFYEKQIDNNNNDNNYFNKYTSLKKITLSINPSNSYKCLNSHSMNLNDWHCTRLVVMGNLANVTNLDEMNIIKKAFKEKHNVMLSDTDLVYRLSISEMKLIQVLTGDSIDVDINQYINARDDVKMLDRNEISIDDKEFVRKMKSISSRKKKLRFANRGGGNIVVMV